MATEVKTEDLEKQLESMLDIEKFPPPDEFRKQALVTDESMYEEAAEDLEGFWSRQADQLIDWVEKPTQTLDESNAPFYKWFADGKLNVSAQLPGPPRRGRQRRPRRLPLARGGGRGARHHLCRAPPRRPALRQRPEGPRHRQGRRRRHLPADDPRGRRRHARLRAHRRPPQRRLRRLLTRGRPRAHGVLRGQGPDHRRRRPPQGQDRPDQERRGPRDRERPLDRDHLRRQGHRHRLRDEGRPRRLVRRGDGEGRRRVPAGAPRRRAPALRPLHLRLHREAEGRPAHHRRLPGRRHLHPPLRLRPEAGVRRLLVRRGRRLGHRPLLHRLRPALQRRHQRHVRGRAGLPGQGHLVGDRRALQGDHPLHGPHRDPRLHEVGRRVPGEARSLIAPPARHRRRADQPQGLALVLRGDRRRALPDRRHLVADRDRPHPDQPAPRPHPGEARLGDQAAAGHRRGRARRRRQRDRRGPGPPGRCGARGRECSAPSSRRTSASRRPTTPSWTRRPTSSATPRARTRTATSGSSAASTTWSTSRATASRPPRSSRRSSHTRRSPSAP